METKAADATAEIPIIYAKYVDVSCLGVVDSKKTPNKEFITYLIDAITLRFRSHYPALGEDFSVKIETSAQVQIIMLARILCISAISAGFKDVNYGVISDLCGKFHIASVERDAWAWFAGALGAQEKCSVFQSCAVPRELVDIAEKIVIAEAVASALPGAAPREFINYLDCAVECVLSVIVKKISCLVFEFWSATVDLEQKTSIRLTNADINGILRLFNHDRVPARGEFFVELGQFASKFDAIKREVKGKTSSTKLGNKKR